MKDKRSSVALRLLDFPDVILLLGEPPQRPPASWRTTGMTPVCRKTLKYITFIRLSLNYVRARLLAHIKMFKEFFFPYFN